MIHYKKSAKFSTYVQTIRQMRGLCAKVELVVVQTVVLEMIVGIEMCKQA